MKNVIAEALVAIIATGTATVLNAQSKPAAQQRPVAQSAGLRIVVIGGEGAVNIIQQRTAVAPLVEVRDANNLPVPGVAVTFSVGGQGATFGGGLQTLTVTTNAVGQAAATGLTPTATITQTNFATAQAAAQAATTAGSGSSAGTTAGAGAGSGGGVSTGAVVGIVGGVGAAAAAGVAVAGAKGDEGSSGGTSFTGTLAGQLTIVQTVTGGTHTSTYTLAFSGSPSGGVITGTVTYGLAGQGSGVNEGGSFTTVFNGSTTFPVTLR